MTVCIATDGYPPMVGGISTFNKHLVDLLIETGHHVVVLYIDYDNVGQDEINKKGSLTLVRLRDSYHQVLLQWKAYFRPGGLNAPNWIASGYAMRNWLLQNAGLFSIDIVEASDYGGCGIFLKHPDLPPVVLTGHGSLLQYSRYNFTTRDAHYDIVRKLEELSFREADAVIAHSLLNKHDLEDLFHRTIDLALIPWKEKDKESHVIPGNDIVVVGGLQPIKGIYDVCEAMRILKNNNPTLKLRWIGGDTWLAPGQQQMSVYLAQKYPDVWQQNLLWEGEKASAYTQATIAAAAVVLVPAFFETFNYIALEASGLSRPMIITESTGASYLFTHGTNALKIPGHDPKAMANAITSVFSNRPVANEWGRNAKQLIHEVFAPAAIISQRTRIYERVIQAGRQNDSANDLQFLETYRTARRKYYYLTRRILKKLIGRS